MPEFQGKKYPYTSAGYRSMMKDRKAAGAVDMKKGGRSQKFRKGGVKKTRKKWQLRKKTQGKETNGTK